MLSEQLKSFLEVMERVNPEKITPEAKQQYEELVGLFQMFEQNKLVDLFWKLGPDSKTRRNFVRAILYGRVGAALVEQRIAYQLHSADLADTTHSMFGGAQFSFGRARTAADAMASTFEKSALDQSVRNELLLSLRLVSQYGEWRCRLYEKTQGKTERFNCPWEEEPFATWNDYTGVHPFIMELCPPHHIWRHYIYNGKVHYLDANDNLLSTPTANWDFKSNKPIAR